MIVTIDGPAGSGKSSAARALADRLGLRFLDTGAMYRVVAWKCIEAGVELQSNAAGKIALGIDIDFADQRVLSDGHDVSDIIRQPRVTRAASEVAQNAEVRDALAERQRRFAEGTGIVTEGRDQGTVVFPHADCKIYLFANDEERARRRHAELGGATSLDEVLEQIRDRDHRDTTRAAGPLRQATDAVSVDSSQLTHDETIDRLEKIVREAAGTVSH